MNTETKTVEVEIVTDDKLVKYAIKTGLEKTSGQTLVDAFRPVFAKARAAIEDAKGVAESVKDATCVKEIRKSRACRLALRAVRLESDSVRKKQKEHALLYGRAVDGFHNILLADLSPVETALQESEDIAERTEAVRLAALKESREKELQPFVETPILFNLSELSEKDYAKTLSDAKLLKQAKLDAIAKAEAEAKAKAEAERINRERIAAENAKLKEEAIARAAAAKAEREAAERKLASERAAAEAAARAAAEKARIEREAVEAKAKAERAAAEAQALKEQRRLQALVDAERSQRAELEAVAKKIRNAEEKRIADAAASEKKAAAAPDNAKAQAFADALRKMTLPKFSTQNFAALPGKVEDLAKWVESLI
jgi:hypothetical protein